MIHVALAIHDQKGSYSRHAGVLIASILRNTKETVCFHIMHDETLSDENRKKLEAACLDNRLSPESFTDFVDMTAYFASYRDYDLDSIGGILTRGTLYRLLFPDVINNVKTVIYLDCDVVVNLDIAELWRKCADMKQTLAGVREFQSLPEPDINVPKNKIKVDAIGVADAHYINAGVLVMNLEKMRDETLDKGPLFKRAVEYMTKYNPQHRDQDFLNAEYLGDIFYVDRKYNDVPLEDYDDVFQKKRIWHFFAKGKPWDILRGSNADMLYWQNLMYTPWKDELVVSLYNAAVNGKYYHRHSKECICRLKEQFIENIKNIKRIAKKSCR